MVLGSEAFSSLRDSLTTGTIWTGHTSCRFCRFALPGTSVAMTMSV